MVRPLEINLRDLYPEETYSFLDRSNVPAACADSSTGSTGIFSSAAPNVYAFDSRFVQPRSLRTASDWSSPILDNRFVLGLQGVYSWNMNQPGVLDVNLDTARGFTLAGEAGRPVYVDPSTTLVNPGSNSYGDTFINEGNAGQNYANYQRPDSPTFYEMWLGESPSDPTYLNHALLKFDISTISGYAIDGAELQLRPYHAYYDAPTERGIWGRKVTSG